MNVSVRLFAGLRQRAGGMYVEVELAEGARVEDLLAAMASTPVGALAPGQCVVAINREYAPASATVRAGDEVALIPPVSGGADDGAGAVVIFEGVTREVDELDYEAYAEMAAAKLRAIGEEEAERHELCAVALEHRVGTVPLGQPSVVVAASAPHRGEAFTGARALIDRVKAEAPIWKVEVTGEGRRPVEGTLPPVAGAG